MSATPAGAWSDQPHTLAAYANSGWLFIAPATGWQATDLTDTQLKIWTGGAWETAAGAALENINGVGINSTYDAFSRLVVASEASRFTYDGAGHQIKINKAAVTDTASLLFQTGFSGRAEMGTAGSDAFSIKVSEDAVTWNTSLSFNPATGRAQVEVTGLLTGTAVTQNDADSTSGRLLKTGDFGLGSNAAPVIADLDSPNTSFGQYRTTSTQTVGTFPTAQTFGHVIIFGSNTSNIMQVFATVVDDVLFMRRYRGASGGWQPWRTLLNTAGCQRLYPCGQPRCAIVGHGPQRTSETCGGGVSKAGCR